MEARRSGATRRPTPGLAWPTDSTTTLVHPATTTASRRTRCLSLLLPPAFPSLPAFAWSRSASSPPGSFAVAWHAPELATHVARPVLVGSSVGQDKPCPTEKCRRSLLPRVESKAMASTIGVVALLTFSKTKGRSGASKAEAPRVDAIHESPHSSGIASRASHPRKGSRPVD